MYRRILTALTVALAGLAIAVPVATARLSLQSGGSQQIQETWTWASPPKTSLPSPADTRQKLEEIGAWAVPSPKTSLPTPASTRQKLEEIGAWAVPSKRDTTTPVTPSGNGFDWNDAGIGAGFALVLLLVGTGMVLTMRRHHPPLAH
jgi:hypothetical protein